MLFSQSTAAFCDFKEISKLFSKVEAKYSKDDLDKLFYSTGQQVEAAGRGDSALITFRYRFCDSSNQHIIYAKFFGGKLVYIQKYFSNGSCYGSKDRCTLALNRTWTYKEICDAFGIAGDLCSIHWNRDGKEQQRTYEWKCCNSNETQMITMADGKFKSSSSRPFKPDYSRPSRKR